MPAVWNMLSILPKKEVYTIEESCPIKGRGQSKLYPRPFLFGPQFGHAAANDGKKVNFHQSALRESKFSRGCRRHRLDADMVFRIPHRDE